MISLITRMRDIRFVRYVLASVGALAVDAGTFLLLLSLGTLAAAASAIGYCLGIVAHWLLSSRTVFTETVATSGRARMRQKGLFVISALAGLVVTTVIVGAADMAGIDPRLGKAVAIVVSFFLTWILRAKVVFRPGASPQA